MKPERIQPPETTVDPPLDEPTSMPDAQTNEPADVPACEEVGS